MQPLADLITISYSPAAAQAHRVFVPEMEQLRALARVGVDVLRHIPSMPGACAVMSALWAARWRMESDIPAYVVAGALQVGAEYVFGDGVTATDWGAAFSKSDLKWNGHCWLAFGEHIADVSLFRTAYSRYSPPTLARHILERFGPGRGLLICSAADVRSADLHYEPRYVLTEDQITGLVYGAQSLFNRG